MSRRAAAPAADDLRVVAYEDFFVRTEAPYRLEERISASGRSYSVKVYERETYTAEYVKLPRPEGRGFRLGRRTGSAPRDAEFLFRRAPFSEPSADRRRGFHGEHGQTPCE